MTDSTGNSVTLKTFDGSQQFFGVVWLFKEGRRPFLVSDLPEVLFLAGSDIDDGNAGQTPLSEPLLVKKADRVGHPDVGDNQVRFLGNGKQDAFTAIGRGYHIVVRSLESHRQGSGDLRVILYDQYFFHALSALRKGFTKPV